MRHVVRAALLAFALAVLGACGDSGNSPDDAGPDGDAQSDAGPGESKLDRPGLPRPPTGGLPDELRPPR